MLPHNANRFSRCRSLALCLLASGAIALLVAWPVSQAAAQQVPVAPVPSSAASATEPTPSLPPSASPPSAQPANPDQAADKSPENPESESNESMARQASDALKSMQLQPLVGWSGSLMYSLEDQKRLRNILKLYEAFKAGKIEKPAAGESGSSIDSDIESLLNEKQVIKKPPPPPDAQFLSSIIYHGADKWSIWLNGQRITSSGEKPKTPEIVTITKTHIEIAWPLADIEAAIPDWQVMVEEKRHDPAASRYLAPHRIDREGGRVIFTLYPNQTLFPGDAELVEGHVAPVAPEGESTDKESGKGALPAADASHSSATPPAGGGQAASPEEQFVRKKQSPGAKIMEAVGLPQDKTLAPPPGVQPQPAPQAPNAAPSASPATTTGVTP